MDQSAFDPEQDTPIWGVPAFAEVLNRTPREVYHLLERQKGRLDAVKVGKLWTSTPRRLRDSISRESR